MSIIIRQARNEDFLQIQGIHIKCFQDSFSTSLGKGTNLLAEYYKEFFHISPELFLVVEDDNEGIVGFCMGYYYVDKGVAIENFKKNNKLRIYVKTAKLLLSFDKVTWKKIKMIISNNKKSTEYVRINERTDEVTGDLLSICVMERYRGNGAATKLMLQFEEKLLANKRTYCQLSVKNDNKRGVHFYEKNGYVRYIAKKKDETVYIKHIRAIPNEDREQKV